MSPSAVMKEMMSCATYEVAQNVAKLVPDQKVTHNGKLLKGRCERTLIISHSMFSKLIVFAEWTRENYTL